MKSVHIVDTSTGGKKVGCPIVGRDVEADQCLCCSRLVRSDLDARIPLVVCELSSSWPWPVASSRSPAS